MNPLQSIVSVGVIDTSTELRQHTFHTSSSLPLVDGFSVEEASRWDGKQPSGGRISKQSDRRTSKRVSREEGIVHGVWLLIPDVALLLMLRVLFCRRSSKRLVALILHPRTTKTRKRLAVQPTYISCGNSLDRGKACLGETSYFPLASQRTQNQARISLDSSSDTTNTTNAAGCR